MADSVEKKIDWKLHFEDFLDVTNDERIRAEERRDYRDLKQWSSKEAAILEARGQPPIVFDQFAKKVDSFIGLEVRRRSDPKAYPVKPKYEKAADAITDALRYVESNVSFDDVGTEVFEEKLVEGYGGVIVEVDSDLNIEVNHIPWDRIYYDPYSRRKDFKDAKYFGITLWLDIDEAILINPEKAEEIKMLVNKSHINDTTFEDRPSNWIDVKRKRVRINQEFYNDGKDWIEVFYVGDTIIREPKASPYKNDKGESVCPIELQCDFIDRNNNRYGYMERLKDVQDEINHRRSKALWMLSHKSVLAERGQFGDQAPEEVLAELSKGKSFIEYNMLPSGNPPVIDSQQELGQSQIAFYQDAQQAMDSVGINPELSGRTESAVSGRAFLARQQGGMIELGRIFARHSEWKTRVYRQIWCRIKQFWTEEKWVRVTNNDKAMKFVGLNIPITRIEKMLEQKSKMDISDLRDRDPELVDQFIQQSIAEDPLMGQVVEKRNDVVEMEMDIIVEEAPETIVLQQEQFEILANLAGTRADPQMFKALVKLSFLPNKDEILDELEPDEGQAQAQAEAQAQAIQIQMAEKMADIEEKQTKAQKNQAEIQEILSNIPLNEAKAKDELASAIERIGKTSTLPIQ